MEPTIREMIQTATKDAKTQVDIDRVWRSGLIQQIQTAYPAASASEIMYEWNVAKMAIRKMV